MPISYKFSPSALRHGSHAQSRGVNMFKGFESRKIDVAGVEISCVVSGLQHTNRTPILMLHGFPQTKAMWNRIARCWQSITRLFAPICAAMGIQRTRPACPMQATIAFVPWPPIKSA
jgi:hypothetical protein